MKELPSVVKKNRCLQTELEVSNRGRGRKRVEKGAATKKRNETVSLKSWKTSKVGQSNVQDKITKFLTFLRSSQIVLTLFCFVLLPTLLLLSVLNSNFFLIRLVIKLSKLR